MTFYFYYARKEYINFAILYFKYLANFYEGHVLGVVYDRASTHYSEGLMKFINKWNDTPSNKVQFVVEFIDASLTSVYQPPDILFNKPFKQLLKQKYNKFVSVMCEEGKIKAGSKFVISRDILIDFICNSFDNLNERFREDLTISKCFEKCGLN